MGNDPGTCPQDCCIAREDPYRSFPAMHSVFMKGGEPVGIVKRLRKAAARVFSLFHPTQDAAQMEIVQHRYARFPFQESKHVLARTRVANVVENPFEPRRIRLEPLHVPDRESCSDAWIGHNRLIDDANYIVVSRQV